MSFTTYAGLLEELTRLIDGEDTNVSDVSVRTLGQIVSLGERRIYREVQSRWNLKAFAALTVTSNLATIPADWESTDVVHFGKKALEPVADDWLRDYLQNNLAGEVRYFASTGTQFTFGPPVANGTAVQGRYFARLPDLSATTFGANTLIAKEPDLFLYGCLSQSAPFFGQDARVPMWEARYVQIRDAINEAAMRTAYSAGRLRIRPSTQLMR